MRLTLPCVRHKRHKLRGGTNRVFDTPCFCPLPTIRKIRAPIKIKSVLPPPPKKAPKYPPPEYEEFYGHGIFLQKERIFPGVHKIDAPISGPRIADENFTDTRIFLKQGAFWRKRRKWRICIVPTEGLRSSDPRERKKWRKWPVSQAKAWFRKSRVALPWIRSLRYVFHRDACQHWAQRTRSLVLQNHATWSQLRLVRINTVAQCFSIPTGKIHAHAFVLRPEFRKRAEYGFGEHGFKHRTQWVFRGSLSSGERTQWVPLSLLCVCQSELTEFFAELTEFAVKLSEAQWVLFSETVLSKQYSARFLELQIQHTHTHLWKILSTIDFEFRCT